ncbi:hypothetical protein N2152v2_002253 [Parachlorella kessleri]
MVRREQVDIPPRGAAYKSAAPTTSFSQLTSAHRRRRSVYYSPVDEGARRALGEQRLAPRLASRPDATRWVERELQALMWQDDVSLVAQHVLGTLRSAAQPSSASMRRCKGASSQQEERENQQQTGHPASKGAVTQKQRSGHGPMVPLKRKTLALRPASRDFAADGAAGAAAEAVAAAVAEASRPYVFEHAERFAWELAAFVASGLGLAAYDRRLAEQQAAAAAGAGAIAVGRGWQGSDADRDPGSGSPGTSRRAGSEATSSSGASQDNGGESSHDVGSAGGALARSDDDDGYLELLLAQGRRRQRLGSPDVCANAAAGAAAATAETQEGLPAAVGYAPPFGAQQRSVGKNGSGGSSREQSALAAVILNSRPHSAEPLTSYGGGANVADGESAAERQGIPPSQGPSAEDRGGGQQPLESIHSRDSEMGHRERAAPPLTGGEGAGQLAEHVAAELESYRQHALQAWQHRRKGSLLNGT